MTRLIDTWTTHVGIYRCEFRRSTHGNHYMVRVILPIGHPWHGRTYEELDAVIDRTVDGFTATEAGPGGMWALVLDTRASGYPDDWTLGILEYEVGELVAAALGEEELWEVTA